MHRLENSREKCKNVSNYVPNRYNEMESNSAQDKSNILYHEKVFNVYEKRF